MPQRKFQGFAFSLDIEITVSTFAKLEQFNLIIFQLIGRADLKDTADATTSIQESEPELIRFNHHNKLKRFMKKKDLILFRRADSN